MKFTLKNILIMTDDINRESSLDFWESLDYNQKLKAFYHVISTLSNAELSGHSYRQILYQDFNFDQDSYGVGMEAGLMNLHNRVVSDSLAKELGEALNPIQNILSDKTKFNLSCVGIKLKTWR